MTTVLVIGAGAILVALVLALALGRAGRAADDDSMRARRRFMPGFERRRFRRRP